MNPTPEASTFSVRLVCRAMRLWCAVSDSTTSAHVARCAACQRHFAGISTLSSALRQEAGMSLAALDRSAERRILHAVGNARAGQAAGATQNKNGPFTLAALAGAAAVAALVVATFLIQPEHPRAQATARVAVASTASMSPEAVLLVEAIQSWSEQWSETVLPSAGALATQNPLQQEMSSAYADARAALDFLALNFLPRAHQPAEGIPGQKSTG